MATLTVPQSIPCPTEDAEQLHKAVQAHRTAKQRWLIRDAYITAYGEDLITILDKETSGDFERALMIWTMDPEERDAWLANEAARKFKPGNNVFVEIAVTRSSDQLFATRRAYHAQFKRSLEEDVSAHTSGDFRKLFVPLVTSYRYEGPEVNMTLAKSEAKVLHDKIEDKAYSDDDLIRILTTRSKSQLLTTFNHYNNEYGHPITKDLKLDPKDEYLCALRAIIRCITCPERYLEKVIRLAVNKMGTDEDGLTHIITTRAEVDLKAIEECYHKRNSVSLEKAITDDTVGDYQATLLALMGKDEA